MICSFANNNPENDSHDLYDYYRPRLNRKKKPDSESSSEKKTLRRSFILTKIKHKKEDDK